MTAQPSLASKGAPMAQADLDHFTFTSELYLKDILIKSVTKSQMLLLINLLAKTHKHALPSKQRLQQITLVSLVKHAALTPSHLMSWKS